LRFELTSTDIPLTFISFFFNDTATTQIYTLSLHDALPICSSNTSIPPTGPWCARTSKGRIGTTSRSASSTESIVRTAVNGRLIRDRKSTRLNSSHVAISYAVFCLKKQIYSFRCIDRRHDLIDSGIEIVRVAAPLSIFRISDVA